MKKRAWVVVGALVLALCTAAPASAIEFVVIPGTLPNATAVTDPVNSDGMVGLISVYATFTDGSTETLIWGILDPDFYGSIIAGVQSSSGWSLSGAGNTYAMQWNYTQGAAPAITSLSFLGANLAFDRTLPSYGTDGSFNGRDFLPDTNGDGFADNPAWTVTYSNAIGLNGAAPQGDLYTALTINFGTAGFSGNFRFLQDTDFYTPAAQPEPVPDPGSSLLLLGGALAALGALRRRLA